jgi:TonB family protein
MKGPAAQPFWTSVILHIAVLALLLIAVLFEAFRPKPKLHIFEMVSPPEVSRVNTQATNSSPQPMPELPQIDPMPKLPEARVIPDPSPASNATAEPPPVINYEEFIREHGKPKPRKPSTSRVTPQPSVPTISTPRLEMPTNPTVSNQPTAQELSELQRYSAQLNSRLKAAWRSPNLGGAQVSVTVVFDVTASGQIINLQLKPASGQFTFDQSIRDVFRKVANAGPTPTGRGHRFSMGFESTR